MGIEGGSELHELPVAASPAERASQYAAVAERIAALLADEDDWVAAMSTVACELHHAFEYFHWTGFYRSVPTATPSRVDAAAAAAAIPVEVAPAPVAATPPPRDMLVIGPYQGHLGCLRIPFNKGVCGAAARTQQTQLVPDVARFPGYIACASSTKSEIVVPVVAPGGVSSSSTGSSSTGGRGAQAAAAMAAEVAAAAAAAAAEAAAGAQQPPDLAPAAAAGGGRQLLLAVLDVDSDHPDAFSAVDQAALEVLCAYLGARYGA